MKVTSLKRALSCMASSCHTWLIFARGEWQITFSLALVHLPAVHTQTL
jgi:hypothetical protein